MGRTEVLILSGETVNKVWGWSGRRIEPLSSILGEELRKVGELKKNWEKEQKRRDVLWRLNRQAAKIRKGAREVLEVDSRSRTRWDCNPQSAVCREGRRKRWIEFEDLRKRRRKYHTTVSVELGENTDSKRAAIRVFRSFSQRHEA